MPPDRVTVTQRNEHTALAITADGEEILLYRGNLQALQRQRNWDWETVTIGTICRCTIVSPERPTQRRRGIEILIIDP